MPICRPKMTFHIFPTSSLIQYNTIHTFPPPLPPSNNLSSALNGWLLHTFPGVKLKVVQHKPSIRSHHPYSSQICYVKMDPITANLGDHTRNIPSAHQKYSHHIRRGRWGADRRRNTRLGPFPSSSRQLEKFALVVGDVLVRAQSVDFDQTAAGYWCRVIGGGGDVLE